MKKLYRELGIRLDYTEALDLFLRRLDDPALTISRGFEANFESPQNETEQRIKAAIDEHRSRMATKLEAALFAQKTRLSNAERSLKEKETKKALEDARIAASKIETISDKLSDLHRIEARSRDNRIFPSVYAGVIIQDGADRLLTPMRYFCRPAGKPAFYDKKFPGLYNARRDNLERFWSEQFGHHHALMVVEGFYENVKRHIMEHRELGAGESEQNVVLQFTPSPPQMMFIACLWSHWTDSKAPSLRGFAAITDDPPADVAAAGHDRCIINLKPEHIPFWLSPSGRSTEELQGILSDREIPSMMHEALKAA